MKKQKGLLIVISGPSGAGKGTICQELLKRNDNLFLSISMTTREPRGTEVNGVEYYFVSEEEFEKRIREDGLLEYAKVHNGKYYGTPKDKVFDMLNKGYDVLICKNIKMIDAGIAQLVEQLIRNQKIAGSNPVSSTIL